MIIRQWHGWTKPENADAYVELFRRNGPNTASVAGRKGAYLLRRDHGNEVEFIVQHIFESMDAIQAALGDDYETSKLIPGAETILSRYDATCVHYDIEDAPHE
jgi:quinol monooxygenase YgiN